MSRHVLVAGATGSVGSRVVARLLARGDRVRAVVRPGRSVPPEVEPVPFDAAALVDPDAWTRALVGVDGVVSCLGASVSPTLGDRASFEQVDVPIHAALAAAARRAGSPSLVYLSVQPGPGYDETRYVRAHLEAERLLAQAPGFAAVRPTGIFTAFDEYLRMARLGPVPVIGDGRARTNPIHPDDVADAVVAALDAPGIHAVGGPEVFTREEIVRAAFAALGRPPRVLHVPAVLARSNAAATRLVHPRLGDLVAFVAAVSAHDAMAPAVGTRTLDGWFRQSSPPRQPGR